MSPLTDYDCNFNVSGKASNAFWNFVGLTYFFFLSFEFLEIFWSEAW